MICAGWASYATDPFHPGRGPLISGKGDGNALDVGILVVYPLRNLLEYNGRTK